MIRYYRTLPSTVELRRSDGKKPTHLDVIVNTPRAVQAFDFSSWKDAPHVALANLRDEPEAVLRFTRTYGVLTRNYKGESIVLSVQDVLALRDVLRDAWEGRTYSPLLTTVDMKTTLLIGPLIAQAKLNAGIQIQVKNLATLISLLFAQDYSEGRLKKCANPDCSAPYFRAVRRGQKFCSNRCAVLINVRKFRQREARRKAKGGRHAKTKKT
jgi:hypothetical protein